VSFARRLVAEGLGTGLLVATVVGSGIMADRLTDDVALALLGNTLPTAAILVVLITIFGPISGAQFNPAVSLVMLVDGQMPGPETAAFVLMQLLGGVCGTFLAHAMFDLPLIQQSVTMRTGSAQWLAEGVASFGLILTILGGLRYRVDALAWLVALYILAAYWFTASTSFANPAVTIARALTDTFAGVRPVDVPAFIAAQTTGALLAYGFGRWLFAKGPDQGSSSQSPGSANWGRR
jgi:glycerol uptake facilitator-like aquaporin